MAVNKWHDINTILEKFLRPETFPLAIRLIKDEEEIPEKAIRPLRDFKCRLCVCQGFSYSKKTGKTVAYSFEDNYCIEGAVALGWVEKPPYMKDGSALYPRLVPRKEVAETLEAMKHSISTKKGFRGIVVSPLAVTSIEPQLVLLSLNAARLNRVLEAICDMTGEKIVAETSGRGGLCAWGLAPAMNTGKPTYVIPTFGEFRFTCDSDDDIWTVIPVSYIDTLLKGLEYTHNAGWRFPIPHFLQHEPPFPWGMYGMETYKEYVAKTKRGEKYEEYASDWKGTYRKKADWVRK
jgi:uncharacterized protein (DUF169 family)